MNEDIEAIKRNLKKMEEFIERAIERDGKFIDAWGATWTEVKKNDRT